MILQVVSRFFKNFCNYENIETALTREPRTQFKEIRCLLLQIITFCRQMAGENETTKYDLVINKLLQNLSTAFEPYCILAIIVRLHPSKDRSVLIKHWQ